MTKRNPNKFSASFTVLDLWAKGDYERAVKTYFHKDVFFSAKAMRGMEEGKRLHTLWLDETRRSKALPGIFGGTPLKNPIVEEKKVVELDDWLDLTFIMDCADAPVLHDYKTGSTSSSDYTSGWQGGVYGVGCTYMGINIELVTFHHYDQYLRKTDVSFRWMTDKYLEDSEKWIRGNAWEMFNYLKKYNLYEQFQ